MVMGTENFFAKQKIQLRVYLEQHNRFSYVPLFSFVMASLSCVVVLVLAVKKIIR